MSDLASLEQRAKTELAACADEAALRAWNTKYFGAKGEVLDALKAIGGIPKEERKAYSQEANRIKEALTKTYEESLAGAKERALNASLTANPLDVTLPGRPVQRGRLHIATQIMRQIYNIFADMGFQVYRTREVESDEMNFELLNMPPHHPASHM